MERSGCCAPNKSTVFYFSLSRVRVEPPYSDSRPCDRDGFEFIARVPGVVKLSHPYPFGFRIWEGSSLKFWTRALRVNGTHSVRKARLASRLDALPAGTSDAMKAARLSTKVVTSKIAGE